jgi:hypothetical protein
LILADLGEAAVLRVEVRRATPQSFRQVGAWGLSPVGNFPDWNRVDERVRQSFDRLTACVRADNGFAGQEQPQRPRAGASTPGNNVPWRLLAALACLLAALWGAWHSGAWRRRAMLGAGMALGTLALRGALLPARFFHQNGQGPLWITALISPPPPHHPYGPGYREVLGWLGWVVRDLDRGVFFAQGVLACLAAPCAAFIARRLGARRSLSWALAFAVAVDPILGRLARSESYYGLGASLLFIAVASLASTLGSLRIRSPGFLLPALASALIIAQHALVHPIGWLAAALCPAVLLLGPGHWRRRLRRTSAALILIAVMVAVTAGPAMVAVLRSPFGAQWMGGVPGSGHGVERHLQLWKALPVLLLASVFVAASARSWRRAALQALVLVVAGTALLVADLVGSGSSKAWIHQAYLRLYAPVALVLLVATMQRLMDGRWRALAAAATVASLAVVIASIEWSGWTQIPTDAQEQEVVRQWRAGLPTRARVAYVERVGRRVLMLPLYAAAPNTTPTPLVLRPGGLVENLASMGQETFYARTSLCTTPEGRVFCAEVEERYQMVPLQEAELPAVPSMVGLEYDRPTVRIGIYRVTGANPRRP